MTGTAASAQDTRPVPIWRLCATELRWVLRRPRTLVMFGLFAIVPVLIAVGVVVADGQGGRGLIGSIGGNGLVLPVAAMTVSLALLLPLAVATASADAIAGESAHGTLRGLLLSPVGRLRLTAMKAFGVLAVAAVCTGVIAVVGVLAGWVVVGPPTSLFGGDGPGAMVTLSGTTISLADALGRVALAWAWTVGQLAAVGAVALAVSAYTEHPLVVLASVLGGLIVFGVVGAIPALDWLQPYLLTTGWTSIADVLRDPMPMDGLAGSSLVALVYLVVGAAVLALRMTRRDA